MGLSKNNHHNYFRHNHHDFEYYERCTNDNNDGGQHKGTEENQGKSALVVDYSGHSGDDVRSANQTGLCENSESFVVPEIHIG